MGEGDVSLEALKGTHKKAVGVRQVTKAVGKGKASVVFLARDAEDRVLRELRDICAAQGVRTELVESMLVLGKACGIEVGAAAAALLRD